MATMKAAPTAQWTEPAAAGVSVPAAFGTLIRDKDGDWAVTDARDAVPAGQFVVDQDGDLAIEPGAEHGLRLVVSGGTPIAYG